MALTATRAQNCLHNEPNFEKNKPITPSKPKCVNGAPRTRQKSNVELNSQSVSHSGLSSIWAMLWWRWSQIARSHLVDSHARHAQGCLRVRRVPWHVTNWEPGSEFGSVWNFSKTKKQNETWIKQTHFYLLVLFFIFFKYLKLFIWAVIFFLASLFFSFNTNCRS